MYRLLERRVLPGTLIGQTWRIREGDLVRFIEEGGRATSVMGAESAQSHETELAVERSASRRSSHTAANGKIEFLLLRQRRAALSWVDMLEQVLLELDSIDAGFLERFSQVGGRTRRYVSKDRDALYGDRVDLAREYSKPLVGGWWLGTNYSRKEIASILEKACETAGLRFGLDLAIRERPIRIDKAKAMAFVGIAADLDSLASVRHDELFAQAILDETR